MESIQDICIELFERLGIEYDEEKLEVFIELMIEQYKAVSDSELDSIESLNRKGTREHIVSNTNAYATNLAGQIYVLPSQLGRISLLHIAA